MLLILVGTVIVDAVGTILIFMTKQHAHGTDIHTLGSAFFFTTVQLLTIVVADTRIRSRRSAVRSTSQLEMWAVLVVAGSAGAFAAFLQDADRPR